MKVLRHSMLIVLCLFLVNSCKKKSDDPAPAGPAPLVNPNNADAISAVLIWPDGSTKSTGNPPSPSSSSEAPDVVNQTSTLTSSNGSTAPLTFTYSNVNGNIGGCYAQVEGASSYVTVPYSASSSSSGQLQLPVGIPTNVDEGQFCILFCIYDANGLVSNVVTTCINVLRLGTGSVQISLSWNTETDQDLHVTDPNGEVIYYESPYSSTGGELDRDDTQGYGPENVFWSGGAPNGTYQVEVHDYEETTTPNSYIVTISGANTSKQFQGTTQNGSKPVVATFTNNGGNISF